MDYSYHHAISCENLFSHSNSMYIGQEKLKFAQLLPGSAKKFIHISKSETPLLKCQKKTHET